MTSPAEVERATPRWAAGVAGAASLLVELAVLRFLPGQIRVLGYFTNFVLLACFVGLGVGMLAFRRWPTRSLAWGSPVGIAALTLAAWSARGLTVTGSAEEVIFLEYQASAVRIPLYPFLALAYVAIALAFMPIGHWVGRTLAGEDALPRYAWNVAGSLAGIGVFSVLAAAAAPPWVWMGIAALSLAFALGSARWPARAAGAFAIAITIAATHAATKDAIWSPYQKISVAPLRLHPRAGIVQEWQVPLLSDADRDALVTLSVEEGFTVRVNDDSYQTPLDLRDAAIAKHASLAGMRVQYDLPYVAQAPGRVLVLGAGSGNDVAAALRAGATHVDAVEIDPELLRLGQRHPERPYADPRVTAHLTDARTFLASTREHWDTVVYGLLDSHVLLSSMSNVRLDSFVFTVESFSLARSRLAPGGVLVVSHAVGTPWFVQRMRATLERAFGQPPLVVSERIRHPLGFVYAAGERVPAGAPAAPGTVPLTDDWPFVYLREPTIPREYVVAMLLVALVSLGLVRAGAGPALRGFDVHFFALGAGFLLLETRGLAVLALVVGSTWGVTSAVFAGVLAMALLGSLVAHRIGGAAAPTASVRVAYLLLALALVVGLAIPAEHLVGLPPLAGGLAGALVVSLPMVASGTIFGTSLARAGSADRALASNLVGAVAGGLVEYLSMAVGFRMLLLVGGVFYALAYRTRSQHRA
ncbi:MAG: hypothetical protein JST00_46415 [Deltaproteobacteria bacterium]|nr:hypothetical protein [Deltaproteobacteria bacterium]